MMPSMNITIKNILSLLYRTARYGLYFTFIFISTSKNYASTKKSISGVMVNGYIVEAREKFPTTGFEGERFQAMINNSVDKNESYLWKSSHNLLVTIDNRGNISFVKNFPVNTGNIIIEAKNKETGHVLIYQFIVTTWFSNLDSTIIAALGDIYCNTQQESHKIPNYNQITSSTPYFDIVLPRKVNGKLWNEWGPMAVYGSGWKNYWYWVSNNWNVHMETGQVTFEEHAGHLSLYIFCYRKI